ncbi:hypothetical protein ACVIIW_002676 [Bradyrhizobium sp. USDA 4449]
MCRAKETGLPRRGQAGSRLPSPGGVRDQRSSTRPLKKRVSEAALRYNRKWREAYTAAVVTPPSITIVWPVMKLEASEAR